VAVVAVGLVCAYLKSRRGCRTGDTRKIFHFVVFSGAGALGGTVGIEGVNLLGGVVAIYVLAVVGLGEGNVLYEGIAREADRPRRSLHVLIPFASTAAGGIGSSLLFGWFSIVGYVVCGWGDAIAEPIGIRFGRHRYRVPGFGGVVSHRSLEGSAAVFVAAFLASSVVLVLSPAAESVLQLLLVSGCVATAATLTEAVTPHGLDNLTVQLVSAATAWALA